MATHSEMVNILVGDEHIAGTFLSPPEKMPGVLFVHGWGGSQQRDLTRARASPGSVASACRSTCVAMRRPGHSRKP